VLGIWLDHHNKIAEAAEFHTPQRMEALPNLGFSPSAKFQDLFYSVYLDTRQTWEKKHPTQSLSSDRMREKTT
jgi:hypothetical protein